jgi:hypothetical protein
MELQVLQEQPVLLVQQVLQVQLVQLVAVLLVHQVLQVQTEVTAQQVHQVQRELLELVERREQLGLRKLLLARLRFQTFLVESVRAALQL